VHINYSQCSGQPNTLPIYTDEPKLMNTTKNGKLYQTYAEDPPLNIIHVYGSPYDMGYAHGLLLRNQIKELMPQVMQHIYDQVDQYINFLPDYIRKLIEEYGVEAALMLTYELTRSYTPQYFYDEIKGISDGSGVDYNTMLAIHMFPELIQAACSMVGAWGEATNNITKNGPLYQLRALDWDTDGPFQKYPLFLVYHPDQGHTFGILTWAGFLGTVTGISSIPMGVSEKVWIEYPGKQSRSGYPFHFLLRDILQFDNTTDDVINRVQSAHRTCSIWIGVGNPIDNFKVFQYAYEYFRVYDDRNYPEYSGHPRYKNVVYVDKHVQPSHNPCLGSLIENSYGSINALTLFQNYASLGETGDMHIAVYDFEKMLVYVSNAGIYDKQKGAVPAYKRRFTRLDLNKLFNEKQ